jgi:hypothetical protein
MGTVVLQMIVSLTLLRMQLRERLDGLPQQVQAS